LSAERGGQDTGPWPAGVVGYDRELELIGIVLEVEMGIGFGMLVNLELLHFWSPSY